LLIVELKMASPPMRHSHGNGDSLRLTAIYLLAYWRKRSPPGVWKAIVMRTRAKVKPPLSPACA
jgi:hypothetical protein